MWAMLALFILYLAVLAAGVYEDGMNLFQFMAVFPDAMNAPISLRWTPHTVKFMLGALLLYVGGIVLYYSSNENKRPGEEHGSARWGNVRELNRKYSDKNPDKNVIITKNLCMSLNGRQHMRNLLQIVVGGSGAGKTRFVVKPNLLLANASFICTDPKGELVRAVAPFLLQQGYVVKVFDLIEPSHSDSYNPFRYIRRDSDVFRLISNFIQNTTPKNAGQNDPFWEKSEIALDSALMLYLLHESPPYEQTLEMMLTMIEYGGAKEEDDDYQSALDLLFEALEEEQPDHIAVRQYHIFKQAAGETTASMKKGLGHFTSTSVWNGNVAVCGHNRGAKYVIGSIKNLDVGDKITYTTSMGTRTYLVETVTKISSSDWSYLSSTTDNRMTLLTCVAGDSSQRWCVQAVQAS